VCVCVYIYIYAFSVLTNTVISGHSQETESGRISCFRAGNACTEAILKLENLFCGHVEPLCIQGVIFGPFLRKQNCVSYSIPSWLLVKHRFQAKLSFSRGYLFPSVFQ
jgi:hypothetical protein